MDEDDPFESPKILVTEAWPSIRELDEGTGAYFASVDYVSFDRIDPSTGRRQVGLTLAHGVPARLRVLASRLLKDLRDALDQATFAATVALGGHGTSTYFPFCTSPTDFETLFAEKRGRCRSIPPGLRPYLLKLEPFPRNDSHEGGNDLLRALGYVSGPNKHQITLKVAPALGDLEITEVSLDNANIAYRFNPKRLELLIFEGPVHMRVDGHVLPHFNICYDGARALSGIPAASVLNQLARMVEGIVLGIEAETARLLRERNS